MPSLHNVSIIFHNPQHKEILMRHASSMPTLCPRIFFNHDTLCSNYSHVFLQFTYFRLIEALRCTSAPFVVNLWWVHRLNRSDFCRSEIHLTVISGGGFHASLVIQLLFKYQKKHLQGIKLPCKCLYLCLSFFRYMFLLISRKCPIDFLMITCYNHLNQRQTSDKSYWKLVL